MTYEIWGAILIGAALLALGLLARNYRAGRLTALQFGAGLVARLAFLFLGIVYVTDLIIRYPRLPIAGLFTVGIGIFLNLLANTIERIRRDRAA